MTALETGGITMKTSGRPRNFDEQAILSRILNLFRRNGYDNTTFEQLVAESGLSRSSLYNAFGGKEELLEKAMGLYIESQADVLYAKLADKSSGEEALGAIIGAFANPVQRGCTDCLVRKTLIRNASSSEPPVQASTVKKSITSLWKAVTLAIGHIRGKRKATNRLSLTNEERAAIIVGLIQGTAVLARTGKQTELLRSIHSGAQKLAS
ncbi:MAG: TetR/AcrR family transcriptional regulator [Pseudomonadota bacterium]